jgi:dTDP-glucose 4,6-dehydratase
LITGSAGFIGSAVVRKLINETDHRVCVVDKLTMLGTWHHSSRSRAGTVFRFEKADIGDGTPMHALFGEFKPDFAMHLAAAEWGQAPAQGPQTRPDTQAWLPMP